MPSIVYLVGPPAAGKLTIGTALSKLTGAALIDNHLINDPILTAYGADGRTPLPSWVWDLVREVRDATMTAVRRAVPGLSHIVTNYLADDPVDEQFLGRMRELAAERDARFVPVWLTCPEDELLRRVALPGRAIRQKMRDPGSLRRELHDKGVLQPPPDALVLDTSAMSAEAAARRIAGQGGQPPTASPSGGAG